MYYGGIWHNARTTDKVAKKHKTSFSATARTTLSSAIVGGWKAQAGMEHAETGYGSEGPAIGERRGVRRSHPTVVRKGDGPILYREKGYTLGELVGSAKKSCYEMHRYRAHLEGS